MCLIYGAVECGCSPFIMSHLHKHVYLLKFCYCHSIELRVCCFHVYLCFNAMEMIISSFNLNDGNNAYELLISHSVLDGCALY